MKFEDLRDECLLYPEHAEQLFQVYLDLREGVDNRMVRRSIAVLHEQDWL
jgi:hypothetical protein